MSINHCVAYLFILINLSRVIKCHDKFATYEATSKTVDEYDHTEKMLTISDSADSVTNVKSKGVPPRFGAKNATTSSSVDGPLMTEPPPPPPQVLALIQLTQQYNANFEQRFCQYRNYDYCVTTFDRRTTSTYKKALKNMKCCIWAHFKKCIFESVPRKCENGPERIWRRMTLRYQLFDDICRDHRLTYSMRCIWIHWSDIIAFVFFIFFNTSVGFMLAGYPYAKEWLSNKGYITVSEL